MKSFLVSLFLLFFTTSVLWSQDFKKYILVLANDSMQGRLTGAKGEQLAAQYISSIYHQLALSPKGSLGYLQLFPFSYSNPHQTTKKDTAAKTAYNVIGYINNLAAKTVVIGAHYDHLGHNEYYNSTQSGSTDIHNGADDNASGVAMLLALADALKNNQQLNKRNYLFIAFSGEELGLLGSNYFVNNPTIKMEDVDWMLNYDMVGRLNEKRELMINGTGTSPQFKMLSNIKIDSLAIQTTESGTGPSDHTSFYNKGIPVLHFFTGIHQDYHKPGDDIEKINFAGMQSIFKYTLALIDSLDEYNTLTFTKTKAAASNNKTTFKVTLGIMPSYAYQGDGLKIDGVTEGKPAQKAGLEADDIIVKLGKYKVSNIEDYMKALGKFKKGNTTSVVIIRNKATYKKAISF